MDFQVKKIFTRKISALSEDWGGIGAPGDTLKFYGLFLFRET